MLCRQQDPPSKCDQKIENFNITIFQDKITKRHGVWTREYTIGRYMEQLFLHLKHCFVAIVNTVFYLAFSPSRGDSHCTFYYKTLLYKSLRSCSFSRRLNWYKSPGVNLNGHRMCFLGMKTKLFLSQ